MSDLDSTSSAVSVRRAEILAEVTAVNEAGGFAPEWESLKAFKVPRWYSDGKFGIFVHWGVYSVPAFGSDAFGGEWYARAMYLEGTAQFAHHVATYGPQKEFGYKDLIPELTAEKFDAAEWARLFRRAGATFVVPVAEHHDGFAMYNTGLSRWKASAMGPGRDVIQELADAVRQESMTFGLSSHRAEHWFFMNGGATFDSGVLDPEFFDLYGPAQRSEIQPNREFLEDWLARTCELVDLYRPELIWFDWWIEEPAFEPYLRAFASYYYNRAAEWDCEVAINYKFEAFAEGSAVHDVERGQLADIRADFWQTDTSVSRNSWGYVADHDYKAPLELIADLVDIVSKNGALLLNVGPRADGTIPDAEVAMLEQIGAWLDVNGRAIYGTSPWRIAGEGPTAVPEGEFTDGDRQPYTAADIRFTAAGGDLFATVLAPVTHDHVLIRSLASGSGAYPGRLATVELLGSTAELSWTRSDDGLRIALPLNAARDTLLSFRIVEEAVLRPPRVKNHY
jgi:alpha-L-fucosidase